MSKHWHIISYILEKRRTKWLWMPILGIVWVYYQVQFKIVEIYQDYKIGKMKSHSKIVKHEKGKRVQ